MLVVRDLEKKAPSIRKLLFTTHSLYPVGTKFMKSGLIYNYKVYPNEFIAWRKFHSLCAAAGYWWWRSKNCYIAWSVSVSHSMYGKHRVEKKIHKCSRRTSISSLSGLHLASSDTGLPLVRLQCSVNGPEGDQCLVRLQCSVNCSLQLWFWFHWPKVHLCIKIRVRWDQWNNFGCSVFRCCLDMNSFQILKL